MFRLFRVCLYCTVYSPCHLNAPSLAHTRLSFGTNAQPQTVMSASPTCIKYWTISSLVLVMLQMLWQFDQYLEIMCLSNEGNRGLNGCGSITALLCVMRQGGLTTQARPSNPAAHALYTTHPVMLAPIPQSSSPHALPFPIHYPSLSIHACLAPTLLNSPLPV